MNYRCLKSCSILVAILASGFSPAISPAFGQITVGLNSASNRTLPVNNMFGTTAADRNNLPWLQQCNGVYANPGLYTVKPKAVPNLNYGVLRIPTGTGANFWDWQGGTTTGTTLYPQGSGGTKACTLPGPPPTIPTYNCPASAYSSSPLSELENEVTQAGSSTTGDYVLNVTTNTNPNSPNNCQIPPGQSQCQYTPPTAPNPYKDAPNESYQKQVLEQMTTDNVPVNRVEVGNELYFDSIDSLGVYGSDDTAGTNYINQVLGWINDFNQDANIKASITYGVVIDPCTAFNSCPATDNNRRADWNSDIVTAVEGSSVKPHAVILHYYDQAELGTTVNYVSNTNADTMLVEPYTTWYKFETSLFPSISSQSWSPRIWYTEYNLHDNCDYVVSGTWANALYTATQSLLAVSEPRVDEALHYQAQAPGATFPDIFESTDAFSNYGSSPVAGITTVVNGYTAQGLITKMLDNAALAETNAEALSFPTSTTAQLTGKDSNQYSSLIGEVFANSTSAQIIILNLYNQPQTVDLSGIIVHGSGTYARINGDAGTYADGTILYSGSQTTGYRAWDQNANPDNLTNTTGGLSTTCNSNSGDCATLPMFSAIRITATLKNPL